jgi:hypothetical protein
MSQSNPDADYALKFRQACQGPSQGNSQAGKPSSRRLCPDAPAGVLSAIARRWHSCHRFHFSLRLVAAKVSIELQLVDIDRQESNFFRPLAACFVTMGSVGMLSRFNQRPVAYSEEVSTQHPYILPG